MPQLDPTISYQEFRDNTLQGIREHFPIKSALQTLELESLEVKNEDLHADDIKGQHEARNKGTNWSSTAYGTLVLKDNKTGNVLSKEKLRLADIPKITRRHSYILDGMEYQVDNQWQLKPGVYVKRSEAGELGAKFNPTNRGSFDIVFEPDTKLFKMKRGSSEAITVYPIMKAMGVDDDTLESTWGKEILAANKSARGNSAALTRFYKVDNKKRAPKDAEEASQYLVDTLHGSLLRPDSTKFTLGKEYSSITGTVLKDTTAKILAVQGGAPEDDRDSILFKDLRSAGDFTYERLTSREAKKSIRDKVVRRMFKAKTVRDLIDFGMFNDQVKKSFHNNSLANPPQQINPVEMLGMAHQTNIMGPGGIQSQNVVDKMTAAKFVNPSHLGFLDPVRTPENNKSGIILRLPLGVVKQGHDPTIRLYNLQTNKMEFVDPVKFHSSTIVLPDQVTWKDGKPTAIGPKVKASLVGNEFGETALKDAHYVLLHPSQLFSVSTNLIPFLGNNSGNRATYADQHIEQAISLQHREAPLVQVATPSASEGINTFEGLIGKQSAHVSPVSGKVTHITKDRITIQDAAGKKHDVQLYNNFPLNDPKAVLHSTPLVSVGSTVKALDTIADNNFTKKGTLALGTNLKVAYIPYKGYNFEDGVVISQSAADKLASVHMHKPQTPLERDTITDPKKFIIQHPDSFSKSQLDKLDETGLIRVGQHVKPGDALVTAMRPFQAKDRMSLQAIGRALSGKHSDVSLRWHSDHEGEVVGVHRDNDKVTVHVRTVEPMQVGDKIAGRHGNKGIVTAVIADDKMPKLKSGEHIEVAMNPSGVPGRMNLGQVLETAAAKIAEKTKKPYIVQNFSRDNQLDKIKSELKAHGLTDQEELHDPATGLSLGKALVGPQYILKLVHTIDKKNVARSGMALPGGEEEPEAYDSNLLPAGGGHTGGQSIGSLDMYTLLAHGAKANIREMQTWKSEGPDPQPNESKKWPSQHYDVWKAIQMGEPLPPPRPTFAFHKFTEMLKGSGINIEKKGHSLQLTPLTNKQILGMSSGEIKKPGEAVYPTLDKNGEHKPKPGGLFDEKVTGGHGGKKWGHIVLAEPIPNPVFEGAIQRITGLTGKQYSELVTGTAAINHRGETVALDATNSLTGGPAVLHLLKQIDVQKDLKAAEKQLSQITLPSSVAHTDTSSAATKADKLVKKIKYLRALDSAKLTPADAYILHNLPVVPPAIRPVATLHDGSVKWGDLNELYKSFGATNTAMRDLSQSKLNDLQKKELRAELYSGVSALMGIGTPYKDQTHKGIMHQIAGDPAKEGYFQNVLMARRQDMSMRSTIVPEPALDLDEVGLPKDRAMVMYRPFVIRKLIEMGAASTPLAARKLLIEKKDQKTLDRALDLVTQERPVLLKRDPALHRHSIQAFRPKIVTGKAIQIHPLVTSGYNADFDGDTMSAYVPVSDEAVEEAKKMMPSNNLFNEASGRVMYTPTLESALGLYKLSRISGNSTKKFPTYASAIKAVQDKQLDINHIADIQGMKTTAGRILLAQALPEDMHHDILTKHDLVIDKKGLSKLFTTAATEHKSNFGDIANRLKDVGNGAAYGAVPIFHDLKGPAAIKLAESGQLQYVPVPTHSLSLSDFEPDRETRDKHLNQAQKKVDEINRSTSFTKREKERRAIDVWVDASSKMDEEHQKKSDANPTNLALMLKAGVKPSQTQYKQMVLAPVLMSDASGKPILQPIKKSYSEGLDIASYWTQQQGARRGTVMKVQEVRDPGTFSKRMVQNAMGMVVTAHDCGTTQGISMHIGDKDLHDRMLAKDFSSKGASFGAGTLLTPQVLDHIHSADKNAYLIVRSPLKCEHAKGLCQKCAGIGASGHSYEVGTNVGILAAQALGERSVQLTMKAFHSGGVVQSSGDARAANDFERVEQLTDLTESIPNEATLAMRGGKIEKIERDPTGVKVHIGGVVHHVGKDRYGAHLHENVPNATKSSGYRPWSPPVVGMDVRPGQLLSDPNRTLINPRSLYKATNNMESVQNFLVDELHGIYGDDVRRQHVETAVRAMSNLTKIRHPGDAEDLLIGEFQPASRIRALNRQLIKEGKTPIEHSPVLKGVDMMPLAVQEDWLAKMQHIRLRDTLLNAAAVGARSNLHGIHPVPGAAYGAEFGMTATKAKLPGLGHLEDVPRFAY